MSPRDRNYHFLLPFSYFRNIFNMKRVKAIKKKIKTYNFTILI
jgi:hypothetical protein